MVARADERSAQGNKGDVFLSLGVFLKSQMQSGMMKQDANLQKKRHYSCNRKHVRGHVH